MDLAKCKLCGERHKVTSTGCPKFAGKPSRGASLTHNSDHVGRPHGAKAGAVAAPAPRGTNTQEASGKTRKVPSGPLSGGPSPAGGEAGLSPRLTPKRGRPLAKDRDKTLTATKPWVAEGISESTWRRRQKEEGRS